MVVRSVRQLLAPLYLFLCLLLGGSAQGIWANMVLQLLGLIIIVWAALVADKEPLVTPARQLLIIAILAILVVALQLLPLPASVWPRLGGREAIAADYRLLGLAVPSLPLSLTPYKSLNSLFGLIPPLAIFCAIVRLKAYRGSFMAAALLAGVIAGVMLGALQVASADPDSSPWYLFEEVNVGVAVGFFANANHMATLLVISLPFLAALVAAARGNAQRYSAFVALAAGAGLVVVVGLALNGSLAGYGLALPVLAASALIVIPARSQLRRWLFILATVLLVAAVAGLASTSVGSRKFDAQAATSVQSRQDILATTFTAIKNHFPWGSGLGSFRDVYAGYEDPRQVTTTFVIHAHDDYAELILETGLAGLVVLVLFLIWWGAAVRRVWQTAEFGPFARAASIASAAMLVHSIVDFPLRTAAISACFGMCLAFLADRRAPQARDASDLRPTRHVTLR